MRFDIVTIFPEYLDPLHLSLIGKARERGDLNVVVHDLRAFATDRHGSVDDTAYGGGPGMVMSPEPVLATSNPGPNWLHPDHKLRYYHSSIQ